MSKWKTCTIGDIGTVVGGATPSTKKEENYLGGKISWITPKDLAGFSGRYISRGERNITEIGLNSCSTQLMPAHTVLFSSRAPIGYVAIAEKEVCTNQGFKSVIPNADTDYMFLYYLLKYNKNMIENLGSGTTFKEVSGATMRNVEIKVPETLEEQKKIASILSALDDKIENNNAINDNLRQQSIVLFDSYYSSGDSYPMKALSDIATIKYGKGLPTKKLLPTGFPVFGGNGIIGSYNSYLYEKPQILVSCRGAASGNILVSYPKSFVTNNSLVLELNDYRYFHFIKQYLLENPLYSYATGSAQPQITIDNIKDVQVPYPEYDSIHNLIKQLSYYADMQYHNICENSLLCSTRDTLLPRLMSGEIDVSGIDL